MVKGAISDLLSDETAKETSLSCTYCGPGTWSTWEVVTDDGVIFACDRHHAELSQAKIIRMERMRGKDEWNKIYSQDEAFSDEYLEDFKDEND